MRRKILIVSSLVVGMLVLALAAGLLYHRFGDLSVYRSNVETLVSEALGR